MHLFPSRADAQALAGTRSPLPSEATPNERVPPYKEWRGERVAPPAPLPAQEPPPWERPLELSRRPVELAGEGGISLPLCAVDAPAACSALGAAVEGAIAALYRPSPYFAAGGALSYWAASGRVGERALEERGLALGARLRVYLMEQGELDPYLELGFGFAEVRSGETARLATRLGPFAEVGGGADVLVGSSVRAGAGVTASDVWVAGIGAERRIGAVFRLAFSFGEPL